jgi:selenocysteine lyase/cysteine desulfurase
MGTVRASFYIYNTLDDAKKLVEAINAATDYFKEWLI